MSDKLLPADVSGLLDALLRQAATPGPALGPEPSPEPSRRITYFGVEVEGDELHAAIERQTAEPDLTGVSEEDRSFLEAFINAPTFEEKRRVVVVELYTRTLLSYDWVTAAPKCLGLTPDEARALAERVYTESRGQS